MGLAALSLTGVLSVYAIQDRTSPEERINKQRHSVIAAMNYVLGEEKIVLLPNSECLITIFGKANSQLNVILACNGEKVLTHQSKITNPTDINYVTQVFNVDSLPTWKLNTEDGCFSFESQWNQIIGWPDCEGIIDDEIKKTIPTITI